MANKKIGFYSDSAGTVPINVTSNTPVGVKTLYTDTLNNTSSEYVVNQIAEGTDMIIYTDTETDYQAYEAPPGYEECIVAPPGNYQYNYTIEPGNGYTVIT